MIYSTNNFGNNLDSGAHSKKWQRGAVLARAVRAALKGGMPAMMLSGFVLSAFAASSAVADSSTDQTAKKKDDQLEEVVVTGQREALQSAQKLKQDSKEIVDSIVAEDIGKLPDRSVVEVLQRIVGVSIDHTYRDIAGHTDPEHFSVEGAGVTIRGLSYTRSELNGRDSFTANGGRSLSFDDVPPELMAAVDVYKNPSGERIEGAIGGLVNLRTLMPFDIQGSRFSASVQESWGDLSRGKARPQISALYSNRWQSPIGELGVLFDLAYSESATRTDGIETSTYFPRVSSLEPSSTWIPSGQTAWVPQGVSWRTLQYKRTREGAYAAFQWRPNDQVESSLTVFSSGYKFHWDENAIFVANNPYTVAPAPGTNFTFEPNNQFVSGTIVDTGGQGVPFNDDTRSANRHSTTTDIAWKTTWDITDHLRLTSDLQHVLANTNSDDVTVALGINLPSETVSLAGSLPAVSVDSTFLQNPANYYWAFSMDGMSRARGKQWAWREDVDYNFDEDNFFRALHTGIRLVDRDATTEASQPGGGYNWQAISQTWMLGWYEDSLANLDKFPGPTQHYNFPNFFNGKAPLPSGLIFPAVSTTTGGAPAIAALQQYRSQLCQAHSQAQNPPQDCGYVWTPATLGTDPSGINVQNERTYAAYLSADFGSNTAAVPYDGSISVRVVHTRDKANGYAKVNPTGTIPTGFNPADYVMFNAATIPLIAENTYTNVLPSLNLRFHLTENLQARLAIAKAIARPDFSQLQAYTNFSSSIDSGSGVQSFTGTASGNPYLKPTKSDQVDATLEWYFAPTGSLTGAVFYKKLSDVIVNQTRNISIPDSTGASHTFYTTSPINGADGNVRGLEVAYQQYFDFLPNVLKGIGMQANYTYIDSSESLHMPVTSAYCTSSDGGAANLEANIDGCDTDGRAFGNLPLQGLSKNAYNLALLYDRGPVSARVAYTWRSKYLMGVNVNAANGTNATDVQNSTPGNVIQNVAYALPVWADDYGLLDASIFYKFKSNFTVGLEAKNLTDAVFRELHQQHFATTPLISYDSGRTFSAQMRVTF